MARGRQTLHAFLRRAGRLFPGRPLVSRLPKTRHRYDYRSYEDRVRKLAGGLRSLGLKEGERVGTLGWNHYRHFELYFAVPCMGSVLHTINPLLPDHHLQSIVRQAEDRLLFVDSSLRGIVQRLEDTPALKSVQEIVVMGGDDEDDGDPGRTSFEQVLEQGSTEYEWPPVQPDQTAGLCFTSGTTGPPKGVSYSHRMLWSHTMASLTAQALGLQSSDVVMPVVPMFHVNAWGIPFAATAAGSGQVFPGPRPDSPELAHLVREEGVTVAAGVPVVWLHLLEYLDKEDEQLPTLDRIFTGGSAVPESVIRRYDRRGITVINSWGMTEMTPIGAVCRLRPEMEQWTREERYRQRAKQGQILPGLEFRVIGENGEEVPWDGETYGELQVRGPWVIEEYEFDARYDRDAFDKGWLKTGDIVTVDSHGYVEIVDRTKDIINSGGEWISSVELENAIMDHGLVREAAVIGLPDPEYEERPVAIVAVTSSCGLSNQDLNDELRAVIEREYPEWWVPDRFVYVDEIPKTATGKFNKKALREQYA